MDQSPRARPPADAEPPARTARPPRSDDDDSPVLPEVTGDEQAEGWGEDPHSGRRDADWYQRERPPHHE